MTRLIVLYLCHILQGSLKVLLKLLCLITHKRSSSCGVVYRINITRIYCFHFLVLYKTVYCARKCALEEAASTRALSLYRRPTAGEAAGCAQDALRQDPIDNYDVGV